MTTVSDLIAALDKFDQSLTVNGAESLNVSTLTLVPVIPAPLVVEDPPA